MVYLGHVTSITSISSAFVEDIITSARIKTLMSYRALPGGPEWISPQSAQRNSAGLDSPEFSTRE